MKKILALIIATTTLFTLTSCIGRNKDMLEPTSDTEIIEDSSSSTTHTYEDSSTIYNANSTEITTPTETIKPTESSTKPADTAPWKVAYSKYIESLEEEKYDSGFSLVYIDSDNIPELFVSGGCEATGSRICSYKNSKLITVELSRLGGASYIPKSGLVLNCNGNSGYYTTYIYRLTGSSFVPLFHALNEETYEIVQNEDGTEECMYVSRFYLYDGSTQIEVTENEFFDAQNKIFNFNSSIGLEYGEYDYNAIKQIIKNW